MSVDTTEDGAARGGLREWIHNHDDSPLFLVLYIGLAIGLSLFVSLFWLAVVVFIHFGFELVRQSRRYQGALRVAIEATWEIKLDIALVWAALALALYIEPLFGLLGLKSASQAARGAAAATRATAWGQALRVVLITADEGALAGRAAWKAFRTSQATGAKAPVIKEEEKKTSAIILSGWTLGDKFSLGVLALMVGLVAFSPWLAAIGIDGAWAILAEELHPLPGETLGEEMIHGE